MTLSPWYQPRSTHDALTCIENISWIIAFLADVFTQDDRFQLSEDGLAGLCQILDFCQSTLVRSVNILLKGGPVYED